MAPVSLKFLCTFVVAILVIMSAGDSSIGAVAARPVVLHGTNTEASLRERDGRRLAVSQWSTTRRAADKFRVSKDKVGPSHGTSDPHNHR